ncbi:MAG TPA: cold shock domain-containing protein [Bacteroidia bacterium]
MKKGKVKFFNEQKKFGFITNSEDGKEYYVHAKDLLSPIKTGDEVSFELAPSKRGDQAVKVNKA